MSYTTSLTNFTPKTNQRSSRLVQSTFFTCSRKCLLACIFIYIGISIAIPGCTLIFIEKATKSREDEVALIFSSRAVGSLAGWLLGMLVLDLKISFQSRTLMIIGILGLSLVYFILIWAYNIWWIMCGYVFQGAFLILMVQGCLAFINRFHLRYKPNPASHLILACLFGCCLTPFLVFPFLRIVQFPPNAHSLSLLVFKPNASTYSTNAAPPPPPLKRFVREVVASEAPSSTTGILSSNSSFTDATLTTQSTQLWNTTSTTTSSSIPATKPAILDAKHLNQDASSADGSQAASQMKQLNEARIIDSLAGSPSAVAPSLRLTTTTPPPAMPLTTTSNVNNSTPSPTVPPPSGSTSVAQTNTFTPYLTTTSYPMTTSDKTPFPSTTTTPTPSTSALVRTTRRSRIAEHRVKSPSPPRILFTTKLEPLQKLYMCLSALGLLLWLFILPDTEYCVRRRVRGCSTSFGETVEDNSFRLRRIASVPSSSQVNRLQTNEHSTPLLEQPACRSDHDSFDSDTEQTPAAEPSYYLSVSEDPEQNPTLDTPRFTSTPVGERPPQGKHPLQWPSVTCPSDIFLLLADLFNTGLETTFGGLIHGFAVRYLLWSPSLAFLAVGLFWFGNLIGRLPVAFVSGVAARRDWIHPNGAETWRSTQRDRRLVPTLYSSVRLFGSCLIVLSASVLTRRSVFSNRYVIPTYPDYSNQPHDHVLWLGGSLLIGLGIGLSSSVCGFLCTPASHPAAYRMQLVEILSQLFVPPLVAYVHHLAMLWRYTWVLASAALTLGVLQCLAILADLVYQRSRRNVAYSRIPTEAASPNSVTLSPARLPE